MLAFIAGTGWADTDAFIEQESIAASTPVGAPSAPIIKGVWGKRAILYLLRHGKEHQIPPHLINYRANLLALKEAGATKIVALNVVGAISDALKPGDIVLPNQGIDYTWGRESTYHDGIYAPLNHIDFTHPYSSELSDKLSTAAAAAGITVHQNMTYGVTQGPRLETAAEVLRLERDGCDIVGMTSFPEAPLSAELNVPYACLALVVNMAPGKMGGHVSMDEIKQVFANSKARMMQVIDCFLAEKS